jgi:catechol 2,3-dioxygenase-like lactoylglutathione lyase family enzyme
MQLGLFSLSLSVRDLGESLAFYQTLGFEVFDDHRDEHWVILSNGSTRIGLFQGMFDRNVLSFRTGDVDDVLDGLRRNGVDVPDDTSGSHLLLTDPDGNPVLIDESATGEKSPAFAGGGRQARTQ